MKGVAKSSQSPHIVRNKNRGRKNDASIAERTMDDLLKNKSLYLGTEELKGFVAKQATNLVINQIQKGPQFSQHDVRKCQSENKLKKYDYLGER